MSSWGNDMSVCMDFVDKFCMYESPYWKLGLCSNTGPYTNFLSFREDKFVCWFCRARFLAFVHDLSRLRFYNQFVKFCSESLSTTF